jgi:hypothetical protein
MVVGTNFQSLIAQAMARLVHTQLTGESVVVSLPIMYPSGAFVGVSISVSGNKCFVSDSAIGLREAEMAGASDFYDSVAGKVAESFGVRYDGASVFAIDASIERVEGAAAAVGNASASAVARALSKAAESKERVKNNVVFDIVASIFGRPNVEKTIDIPGRDAVWPAHNVVTFSDRHRAIFEFVSAHTNSVANKYMMFSDISKIEDHQMSLVSVVNSIETIGAKGAMLADVSNVIELTADRSIFKKYARAA